MSEYRNYVYDPVDGEEIPENNTYVEAIIAGQPATLLSVIVSEPLVTAGTIYYIGTQAGPEQLLPPDSVVLHSYAGWPMPTDTMPEAALAEMPMRELPLPTV